MRTRCLPVCDVYVYASTCISFAHLCLCTCIHAYTNVHEVVRQKNLHAHVYARVKECARLYVHICIHIYIHTHLLHTYTCIIYTCVDILARTCTLTWLRDPSSMWHDTCRSQHARKLAYVHVHVGRIARLPTWHDVWSLCVCVCVCVCV